MFGRLIQRQVHVTFASAAVLLLKVVRLLPYFFDTSGILALVRDTANTLGHVSGRSHARILRQMLKRFDKTRQDRPSDPPQANVPVESIEATVQQLSAPAAPSMDELWPPDVLSAQALQTSAFWNCDAHNNGSLLQVLSGIDL
jgi:hypothetical protein